jgi:hypothetical protein
MSQVFIGPLPGERRVSYSAAWFVPIDLVTGSAPGLPLRVLLDIPDGQGWTPTGIRPAVTLSGALSYPDLGRSRDPAATPRRYRARFEADEYLALGRAFRDGEEFLAHPFNNTTPPAEAASRVPVELAPAAGYPFPRDLPVLNGQVITAAGKPVPDVLVTATVGPPVLKTPQTERTLTGRGGAFALPLRWAPAGQVVTVVATDHRHTPSRTGQLAVRLPGDLGRNQTIVIR